MSRGAHLDELKENLWEAFGLYFEGANQVVLGGEGLNFEFLMDS